MATENSKTTNEERRVHKDEKYLQEFKSRQPVSSDNSPDSKLTLEDYERAFKVGMPIE